MQDQKFNGWFVVMVKPDNPGQKGPGKIPGLVTLNRNAPAGWDMAGATPVAR